MEGIIRFWESKLKDKGLFEPSTVYIIEKTVLLLRELQKLKEEKDNV